MVHDFTKGQGLCLVNFFTGHGQIWTRVQEWTRVQIWLYPVDTCLNLAVSSEKIHWTRALPFRKIVNHKILFTLIV